MIMIMIMMKLGNAVVDIAASIELDRIGLDCKLGCSLTDYAFKVDNTQNTKHGQLIQGNGEARLFFFIKCFTAEPQEIPWIFILLHFLSVYSFLIVPTFNCISIG